MTGLHGDIDDRECALGLWPPLCTQAVGVNIKQAIAAKAGLTCMLKTDSTHSQMWEECL